MKIKLKYYQEFCCDEAHKPIQTHFDCPICKVKYAPSSIHGSIADYIDPDLDNKQHFNCIICKSNFKISKRFLGYHIEYERV